MAHGGLDLVDGAAWVAASAHDRCADGQAMAIHLVRRAIDPAADQRGRVFHAELSMSRANSFLRSGRLAVGTLSSYQCGAYRTIVGTELRVVTMCICL